jgi:hypothetical protein
MRDRRADEGGTLGHTEIRRRHGRGLAIVGQDNLRRQVLRERDVPGGAFPVDSTC